MLNYYVIFPGVGAFDHLFGPGGGNLKKIPQKFKCPGGFPRGDAKASIGLVHKPSTKFH